MTLECPGYPQKRTFDRSRGMSASCHFQTCGFRLSQQNGISQVVPRLPGVRRVTRANLLLTEAKFQITTGKNGANDGNRSHFRIPRCNAETIREFCQKGTEGTWEETCQLASEGVVSAHGWTHAEGLAGSRCLAIESSVQTFRKCVEADPERIRHAGD